mmetsp:Transcript_26553/g.41100  ORF Transcript_26553/g.41100 Transcript_26553/m.41100 type:complete len:320 (-) Transcript_26553:25-984(-)
MEEGGAGAVLKRHEAAFEETFPAICHELQLAARFVRGLGDNTPQRQHFEQKFFEHYATPFAARLVVLCELRHGVEAGTFGFGGGGVYENMQRFCAGVDHTGAVLLRQRMLLDHRGPGTCRNPYKMLGEAFPPNVGLSLRKIWASCGLESLADGCVESGEGDMCNADFEAFIALTEELCLSVCGVPFKKLDKKTEKKFALSRRQGLQASLRAASTPRDVLEKCVLVLYQQVRKTPPVVGGSVLQPIVAGGEGGQHSVLRLLLDFLPERVKTRLLELEAIIVAGPDGSSDATDVADGTDVAELITFVRECGLCKDINKFEI